MTPYCRITLLWMTGAQAFAAPDPCKGVRVYDDPVTGDRLVDRGALILTCTPEGAACLRGWSIVGGLKGLELRLRFDVPNPPALSRATLTARTATGGEVADRSLGISDDAGAGTEVLPRIGYGWPVDLDLADGSSLTLSAPRAVVPVEETLTTTPTIVYVAPLLLNAETTRRLIASPAVQVRTAMPQGRVTAAVPEHWRALWQTTLTCAASLFDLPEPSTVPDAAPPAGDVEETSFE